MSLRSPPLAERHEAAGARFTDFGGWEMPVEFDSVRTEHAAVRDATGTFDVSHMGEVVVDGPDATRLTQRMTTNEVTALDPGEAHYAATTRADGVIVDDTVVYRLPEDVDGEYLFVPNAGHDREAVDRWRAHRGEWGFEATLSNRTTDYAMIAVQGPDAPALVAAETAGGLDPTDLDRFELGPGTVAGVETLVAHTGYSGEDGFELICPWDDAGAVWDAVECQPCGLGARDTFRLRWTFSSRARTSTPRTSRETPTRRASASS